MSAEALNSTSPNILSKTPFYSFFNYNVNLGPISFNKKLIPAWWLCFRFLGRHTCGAWRRWSLSDYGKWRPFCPCTLVSGGKGRIKVSPSSFRRLCWSCSGWFRGSGRSGFRGGRCLIFNLFTFVQSHRSQFENGSRTVRQMDHYHLVHFSTVFSEYYQISILFSRRIFTNLF